VLGFLLSVMLSAGESDYPPSDDFLRFPSAKECDDRIGQTRKMIEVCNWYFGWYEYGWPERAECWRRAAEFMERQNTAWGYLLNCWQYGPEKSSFYLNELRKVIGNDAYYSGRMPELPVWRD